MELVRILLDPRLLTLDGVCSQNADKGRELWAAWRVGDGFPPWRASEQLSDKCVEVGSITGQEENLWASGYQAPLQADLGQRVMLSQK